LGEVLKISVDRLICQLLSEISQSVCKTGKIVHPTKFENWILQSRPSKDTDLQVMFQGRAAAQAVSHRLLTAEGAS
jgi:hypothetical protein